MAYEDRGVVCFREKSCGEKHRSQMVAIALEFYEKQFVPLLDHNYLLP
jgi:hypothetical protein